MPKRIIRRMRQGGVDNPHALLRAAGYREGDSEQVTLRKLRAYGKRKQGRSSK